MLGVIEDSRNEFKVKLPDDLEETVIGFLNSKDGGNINIGISDNGKVVGLKNHGIISNRSDTFYYSNIHIQLN